MERNVNVIKDIYGNNIVVINDIRFKGKRSVKWDDVKKYLEQFIGEFYEIADTKDIVYKAATCLMNIQDRNIHTRFYADQACE